MRIVAISILICLLTCGCGSHSDTAKPSSITKDSQSKPDEWPFNDPKNQAVITINRIVNGQSKILYVTHDESDGGWQFLDGGDVTEADAMVVGLSEMVELDPTLKELADLPLGWYAERDGADAPWKRAQQ